MSHIVFPNEFAAQVDLLDGVMAQNEALGTKSPLAAWLKAKGIDLMAYKTAAGKAQACEKQRLTYENVSEQSNQERDELFAPVFQFVMQGAQLLKAWYKPTYALLKDWGVPITASGRIDYPSSFEDRSAIATAFFDQYDSYDAETNPLTAFVMENEIDVAALKGKLADAIEKSTMGITNAKLGENATAERNKYMAAPVAGLRAIGDYLKSVYVKNPKTLGEWGFVVDEGGGKAYARKTKLRIGETKVLKSVRIGSILTVTGKGEIVLYRGEGVTEEMYALKAGEKMGMTKGFNTITVVNPSTLETTEINLEMAE